MNEIKVNKPGLKFPIIVNKDEYIKIAPYITKQGYHWVGDTSKTKKIEDFNPFTLGNLPNKIELYTLGNDMLSWGTPETLQEIKRLQQLAGIQEIKVNNPLDINIDYSDFYKLVKEAMNYEDEDEIENLIYSYGLARFYWSNYENRLNWWNDLDKNDKINLIKDLKQIIITRK